MRLPGARDVNFAEVRSCVVVVVNSGGVGARRAGCTKKLYLGCLERMPGAQKQRPARGEHRARGESEPSGEALAALHGVEGGSAGGEEGPALRARRHTAPMM